MALAEQGHGKGLGLGVYAHFGLEVDAHAHDIFGGVEVGCGGGRGRLRPTLNVPRPSTWTALESARGVGENLLELTEHGDHDVGVIWRYSCSSWSARRPRFHRVDVERTSIPFTLVGTIFAVVLAKFVKYWHN